MTKLFLYEIQGRVATPAEFQDVLTVGVQG